RRGPRGPERVNPGLTENLSDRRRRPPRLGSMRVTVTGSSGLIGSALVQSLRADGHDVVRLIRREPSAPDEARWSPADGCVEAAALDGVDAVVHLAGAGVGDRPWTKAYKRRIRDSRIVGTRTIADRKSTRLNSSHVKISYAVFCLKKKNLKILNHKYKLLNLN